MFKEQYMYLYVTKWEQAISSWYFTSPGGTLLVKIQAHKNLLQALWGPVLFYILRI